MCIQDVRRISLGIVLAAILIAPANAVDCEYLKFLYEGVRKECESGVTHAGVKYQPCETMAQMTEKFRACTKRDTSCLKISDTMRHLDGCYVKFVKKLCDKPLRIFVQGVDSDPGRQRYDNHVMSREVEMLKCCGGGSCRNFQILHAEPVK